MTQYDWKALLVAVAKAAGWEHWNDGTPIHRPPFGNPLRFPLSPDSLDDIAALMERADLRKFDGYKSLRNPPTYDAMFQSRGDHKKYFFEGADTLAHALLLALASALQINVAEFAQSSD